MHDLTSVEVGWVCGLSGLGVVGGGSAGSAGGM